MSVIHHPHDNFFKSAMSNLNVAMEFLQHYLPADLQAQLDLTTLDLQRGTYVNQALKSSASDVLFKVHYKEKPDFAYIYILVEQQSSVEHLMPFRLLEYMTSIWREDIRKDEKKGRNKNYRLPLIIPLLFYSGPDKYYGKTDIRDLIAAPKELIEAFLFKPFYLIDLHEIKDEEMKTRKWFGVIEFAMRHVREREILDYIQSLLGSLRLLCQEEKAVEFNNTVLKYVLSQGRTEDPKRLKEIFNPTEGDTMGTLLDYLFEDRLEQRLEQNKDTWVQSGVEQGVQKGEGKLLIRLLELKFKTLPKRYRQQIELAAPEHLLKWGEKVLTSQSVAEVFAD